MNASHSSHATPRTTGRVAGLAGLASRAGLASLGGALVIALVAALVPRLAHADVPGRVGRIAFIEGDVQAYSESEPEWKVAYLNQPITSRNSVFVGDAGRAEISVGSTTLALDAGSQVDIQQLDDDVFEANVVRGRISMRVRRLDADDVYTVAIPGADIALLKPGRYRIDALPSSGGVTVFAGQASIEGDRGPVLVEAGNGLRVVAAAGDPNAPPQLMAAAPVAVPLDDWVVARETRFRDGQAERYVSPNMTGYEDLDANGRWATEEDLGPVWYPTTHVQADWAPYRYGRWAYVAPWGYTWIDDAPWGFAPFHYGRWVQVGSRWGWTPGAYVARPVYAPALVGFYGGSGFSASFSIGTGPAVGWYPLAPWQRYSPHYTRNTTYVNRVNNITIVEPPRRFAGNGSRDWNRERGGTLAPQDAFRSQRSISRVVIAEPRNFGDRGRPVDVGDLPRPAPVPGAVRRGPEGRDFNGRPDFRSPREFANRPNDGSPRSAEQGGRPGFPAVGVPSIGQENGRGGLPPNYRRPSEQRRPTAGAEPGRPGQGDAPAQFPRAAGPGSFDREARPLPPQQQSPQPQTVFPGAPAGEGQGFESQRYNPRVQGSMRGDGDGRFDPRSQPGFPERSFERPNREFRNVQPQPQRPAERQVIEQPQRFERPAPPQMQPQIQPQAPPPQVFERPPQRFERPQPMIERQQRVERPAPPMSAPVAPVAPVAPMMQPRSQPPQAQPGMQRGDDQAPRSNMRER